MIEQYFDGFTLLISYFSLVIDLQAVQIEAEYSFYFLGQVLFKQVTNISFQSFHKDGIFNENGGN